MVLALGFAAMNLWIPYRRSGIPIELSGTVERIDVFHEKHEGVDDVYLVEIDGETFHLDRDTATRLRVGETLGKPGWDRFLDPDSEDRALRASADVKGMLAAMPILLGIGLALLLSRRASRS